MKRIYNYMLLAIMALATAGCAEEMNKDFPSAESGDEVQFGLSLPGMTRTIYGDRDGDAYPIYWVNGDKVQIISHDCLAGRNNAEYKVSVSGATQNYATSLTPTGDYGVQWGDQPAVFYSVYPSGKYTISDDGSTIKNLKINFSDDFEVIDGTITPKQADCLMFAKTDEVPVGETVNLTYSPIATAVKFTLNGPSDNDKSLNHEHTIQYIKLIAPKDTYIAGNFDVKLETSGDNKGKYVWTNWVEGGDKSNVITAQLFDKATGEFHKIGKDEKINMSMFLAPRTGLAITNDWKIEVLVKTDIVVKDEHGNDETQSVTKTFTKSLGMKNETTDRTSLKPGMVHELPALPSLDVKSGEEWKPGDWMVHVPRNVYLSEVSIPGTWNSLNVDCQSNTSISDQYDLGVRAFHLDTRWRADNRPSIGSTFTGGRWGTVPTITELSVATGGSDNTYKYDDGNLMRPSFSSFAEYLKQITDNVKDNEYMVVFCTFSHNSYNGDLCPSKWFEAVSNACAANDKVYNASSLAANTLVGDVLGKVIVIVNLESSVSDNTLPANSKCLFTYVPMQLPSDYYAETSSHTDALYYSTKSLTGISMYTSHAQISTTGTSSVNCGDRGYSHPLTSRDNLVTSFWDWSKTNYANKIYEHDKWIYLGLGGYIMTSSSSSGSGYDTVENRYAPMIYNRIDEMGSNNIPFYPIGIILMNNKKGSNYTDGQKDLGYDFKEVCKKILLLNNEYRLQYDPNKPSNYNPNATQTPQSVAPSYSSGMNDSDVAAFGWD